MARYKIIVDSSCELPQAYMEDERFVLAPFRVEVDGVPIRDAGNTNTKSLLEKIVDSKTFASLTCPSPDIFYDCISKGDADRIYIITISSQISGCFVSAKIAKKLYEDAHNDKEIFVIDSKSISGGESQLALLAMELEEQGLAWDEIKKKLTAKRDQLRTVVLLDNVSALYKNIKFSKIKEAIIKRTDIKTFFSNRKVAEINGFKDINIKESLNQLAESISSSLKGASEQTRIIITHCNNLIDAEKLRDLIMEKTGLKNFVIMSASVSSSMFVNEGGLFVTY